MLTPPSAVLKQLEELQKQLATLDQQIEGANTSIQAQRAARAALQAQIAPLLQLGKQVTDSQAALQKEREDGTKLLAETSAFRDQLLARLKAELSAEIIAKIDQGVQAIDGAITAAEGAVHTCEGELAGAGATRDKATAAVKAAEGQRADTLNQLRQLPKAAQAASGDVRRLRKELEDAAKAGNLPRAYYLAGALGAALARLKTASSDAEEKRLLKQLDDQSGALTTARQQESDANAEVQRHEASLKAANDTLGGLKKQRQQQIDDLLSGKAAAPAATAAPAAAPAPAAAA